MRFPLYQKNKSKNKAGFNITPFLIIFVLLFLFSQLYNAYTSWQYKNTPNGKLLEEGAVLVHFVDVNQGDCILIQDKHHNILIDTGSYEYSKDMFSYLEEQNIDGFDLVVLTHPHEDHVGSFVELSKLYNIKQVLKSPYEHNTKTYYNVEKALVEKDIPNEAPSFGSVYVFGDIVFTIVSDENKQYEKVNDYSLIIKMEHEGNSFIFTGDAESSAEHDLVAKKLDLSCDVLNVGHHGSYTSTTAQFLYETSPIYAVIQCGTDNAYGYPHKDILRRLEVHSINVLRNDLLGNIVFISTAKGVTYKYDMQE